MNVDSEKRDQVCLIAIFGQNKVTANFRGATFAKFSFILIKVKFIISGIFGYQHFSVKDHSSKTSKCHNLQKAWTPQRPFCGRQFNPEIEYLQFYKGTLSKLLLRNGFNVTI